MIIDAQCLYEARIENVERLATSLGLELPTHVCKDRAYTRKLIRIVIEKISKERRHDRRQRFYLS